MTTESEYLLGLYIVEHRSAPPVSSGRLAAVLDRSPAATTEMLQRLETRGLVDYEPYEGATLTPSGRDRADGLHRSYVTLSWFFRAVLDLDAAEREAMRMAGIVSPSVTDRLAETLLTNGDPREVIESGPPDRGE
ncbi:iron (metal) dependent repressor, DtxR family [Halopenitus malekzadehii]|uniref:Iron (Metal) dependent repressor, DtxR family n=1 Tax=Halopenitus malekzadehii TaxID=1267564 RepID=A0A1H6JV47_9EURY|nr:metal-dependent transcriptional regulator [Halopenitus malekzadehii]SEH66232.1 iron (metal) dependent repressor, DtxR family [Halopenitus malekzadehii]